MGRNQGSILRVHRIIYAGRVPSAPLPALRSNFTDSAGIGYPEVAPATEAGESACCLSCLDLKIERLPVHVRISMVLPQTARRLSSLLGKVSR